MSRLNLSKWAVDRPALVLFLMLVICAGGLMSYFKLGRAEDPSFTIKVANVTATWPGSSASEIRDQVQDLLEKRIQELPYLDKIDSYAKPGFLAMSVTFKDTTPPALVPWLFYLLRKKMNDAAGDLPAGVKGPNVNDEYGDVDSVLYAVSGEGADYHQLDGVVEILRQRLLATPDAVKLNVYGNQGRKIFIEFSQAKLANLGLAPQAIFEFAGQAERNRRRWRFRDFIGSSPTTRHGRARGRRGHFGAANRRQWANSAPWRHSDNHKRVRGSAHVCRAT